MTTSAEHPGVPQFDLADRMRKALRISGVGAQEMADYLGVNRNTVSNWINGHHPPDKRTKRLWAMRTGVPFEWLDNGEEARASTTGRYQGEVVTLSESSAMQELPTQIAAAA